MPSRMTCTRRGALALAGAALACLSPGARQAHAQAERPVLVFAAASLQPALTRIGQDWTAAGNPRVTFSFAGTPALARQLEQGAQADVFLSADVAWMDWAQGRNLIARDSRRDLLGNSLVLIAGRDAQLPMELSVAFASGLSIPDELGRALGDSRLALANPQTVPAGRYARQALQAFGAWEALSSRLAPVENVRLALALVARGEARFGIVYATDAASEPRVQVITRFGAGSHEPILYPAALTPSASPAGRAFFAHLASPAARRIFEADGFRPLF
jgi:molybdate transport system substrate-binding protein